MSFTRATLVCLLVPAWAVCALEASTGGNPLRKIVGMLQEMSEEVEAEGKRASELFENFMCYCKTNKAELTKSVADAKTHVDKLTSAVEELSGSNNQLKQEIKDLLEDAAEAKKAVDEATSQRQGAANAYSGESAETISSIGALDKAIPAIQAGTKSPAEALAQLGSMVTRAATAQATTLQSMLSGTQGMGSSDEILGILEQMRDDFKQNLAEMTQAEQEAIATFEELKEAKVKQIKASTAEATEKEGRLALQKQQVADYNEDLEDTSGALQADQDFLAELTKTCETKTKENEAQVKARNQEIVGIGEAVKILNGEEFLQKRQGSEAPNPTSFLQVRQKNTAAELRRRAALAAASLRHARLGAHGGAISLLAIKMQHSAHSKKPGEGFGPLKTAVSNMIAEMHEEQADDDEHLESCKKNLKISAGEKKDLEDMQVMETNKMDALKVQIEKLQDEIGVIKVEIRDLDAAVAEATEQRKKEKTEFTKKMSELSISSNLLIKAKTVLERMYAPKKEEEEPAAASFLDASSLGLVRKQAPETASYSKKGGAGMGVVGLLLQLNGEIKTEQQTTEMTENEAQKDFDELSAKTAEAKEAKKKDMVGKEAEKSRLEEKYLDVQSENGNTNDEHTAVVTKIASLHSSCDFLIENHGERKKARADEEASLTNALAILSGADMGPPPAAESA